ncbi:Pentatricopeptide repeat-containing protein [Sesbania bispinosa]|nr:Pentatricopeptide repeat-containing protein [Sesbania bispinosa]
MFMSQILQYMKENRLVLRYPVFVEALEALKNAGESDTLLRQVNPQFYKKACESITVAADSPVNIDKKLLFVLLRNRNVVAIDHLLAGMMDKKILLDNKIISTIIEPVWKEMVDILKQIFIGKQRRTYMLIVVLRKVFP